MHVVCHWSTSLTAAAGPCLLGSLSLIDTSTSLTACMQQQGLGSLSLIDTSTSLTAAAGPWQSLTHRYLDLLDSSRALAVSRSSTPQPLLQQHGLGSLSLVDTPTSLTAAGPHASVSRSSTPQPLRQQAAGRASVSHPYILIDTSTSLTAAAGPWQSLDHRHLLHAIITRPSA